MKLRFYHRVKDEHAFPAVEIILLEPILILAVGAVTGIIVAGAILPIFEINGLVS